MEAGNDAGFRRAVGHLIQLLDSQDPEWELKDEEIDALLSVNHRQDILSALFQQIQDTRRLVELLLQQAFMAQSCRCKLLTISLLVMLVRNSSARRAMLASDRHLVIRFSSLLKSSELIPEVESAIAELLWEFAYWTPGKAMTHDDLVQVVEALVRALKKNVQCVRANVVGALASVAYKNAFAKEQIRERGAIVVLVEMLDENAHRKELVQASRALWILADNNLSNQAAIRQAGAVPLLVRLLQKDDPEIVAQAAWVISRLAFKCRENQDLIGSPDLEIISNLVRLLNKYSAPQRKQDEVVLEKVALALRDIAMDHERNSKEIANEDGAINALLALLEHKMEVHKVHIFVSQALAHIACQSDEDVKRRAHEALDKLMNKAVSPKVKDGATKALQMFVSRAI